MNANVLASCAVNAACFTTRRPTRRTQRSQLACTAAQKKSDEEQSPAQKLAAAGLAAILLAGQPQPATAKDVAVASQDDLLNELLQKNGGKGVKVIRAPKQKEQSVQEASPYSISPKPVPAPTTKGAPVPAKAESLKGPSSDKVKFSGPVRSGTQGEYPKGYEGNDTSVPKGKSRLKSAASNTKSAAQSAVNSNPLLARREAGEAAKKAASAVKSAAPDLPKVELPNPFKQSAPEKQPAAPNSFANPLAAKRDAEAAARKAASAVKDAVPDSPKIKLPNLFEQKPKLPEAPATSKPAFTNPLAVKRDAEAAAKKAVSAVQDAVPDGPKIELPKLFEQKPKLPEAPSASKPAFTNPLAAKRDAEAAARKTASAVKDAVPDAPKIELPNLFEQKPKLPEAPSTSKPAFTNPLAAKRDAEAAAKKAVSAVKDAVPDSPKFELPNLFDQKPKLPEAPSAAKSTFKNPLLAKRKAEDAAKKAVSTVKDAVQDTVKDAPKFELPSFADRKPQLPKAAPAQKPAFENPLLAKRKAEDALKGAASAVSKAVPENPLQAKTDSNPLGAAAAGAAGASAAVSSAASSASSGVSTPSLPSVSLPSVSLPSLPTLGSRTANDTTEAVGVVGAELVAAFAITSIVGAITADVPRKKELNR